MTDRKAKKAKIEISKRWNAAHMKAISFRFDVDKDAEVLAKLDRCPNKTDYVRKLIKDDIEKNG